MDFKTLFGLVNSDNHFKVSKEVDILKGINHISKDIPTHINKTIRKYKNKK